MLHTDATDVYMCNLCTYRATLPTDGLDTQLSPSLDIIKSNRLTEISTLIANLSREAVQIRSSFLSHRDSRPHPVHLRARPQPSDIDLTEFNRKRTDMGLEPIIL